MTTAIHVLGVSGSLRQDSYNSAALRAALDLLPEGMTMEIADISQLPFYNADLDVDGGPAAVRQFKGQIASADALLFATPEYNYSLPGVLKNAIDWASFPAATSPLDGKPIAIMGASVGNFGTARAQLHLRQVAVFSNMLPVNKPHVLIARAAEKFDSEGQLTDEMTRQFIRDLLESLATWTRRLRGEPTAS